MVLLHDVFYDIEEEKHWARETLGDQFPMTGKSTLIGGTPIIATTATGTPMCLTMVCNVNHKETQGCFARPKVSRGQKTHLGLFLQIKDQQG